VSLFLATKVEETCRKIKEFVIACCRVAQKNPNLLVDEQTRDFWKWRDTIMFNEDLLLETICFDLTVEAPHRILFEMLKHYNVEHNKRLRNAAWAFINDSNLTQLCVLFTARTIAASALYCGAKLCDVQFPDDRGRPWWEVQHVNIKDIRRACNYMAGIYEHVPPKDGVESIYVGLRTPEDGDPRYARTRLRNSQTPQSPSMTDVVAMERSASSQSLKRTRDEEGMMDASNGSSQTMQGVKLANGHSTQGDSQDAERLSKRPKTDANGGAAMHEEEEGSEEGELEE
jgi:protein BUR2